MSAAVNRPQVCGKSDYRETSGVAAVNTQSHWHAARSTCVRCLLFTGCSLCCAPAWLHFQLCHRSLPQPSGNGLLFALGESGSTLPRQIGLEMMPALTGTAAKTLLNLGGFSSCRLAVTHLRTHSCTGQSIVNKTWTLFHLSWKLKGLIGYVQTSIK